MRILIVEDDFVGRKVMHQLLLEYGECDVAVDGVEAVKAFDLAWEANQPYDVMFLDIMMPNMSGHEALKIIRDKEKERGVTPQNEVRVIMTSALDDVKNVTQSFFQGGASAYLVKPIERRKVIEELRKLGLV
ncbi:two-component system, chemotaxis family, response regulator CheY [Desulfomicrobium apsheronum]|uniref:Two-component system, chemotaxis family, response regulator CheY n=3 Tax=Desulfomicrobium TaxID=898 RepID=A0A1I3YC13_9BACT|nr:MULTISPECIES: response regulator [Desulfomicrobium]MBE1425240.1 two-component system chemotaxis response regulator CheY [Desulfomicrobium macestii]MDY0227737.1 response regulator [Desulfomicrobium apsheronum]SFK29467.1 two-component system, chemotaxis family, response regulator CheY [Desulfomicrobium apsheronum]SFL71338.1 two-component system, chemotaxis family, response regulator CheY [Desulfomicrobium norvegicum]